MLQANVQPGQHLLPCTIRVHRQTIEAHSAAMFSIYLETSDDDYVMPLHGRHPAYRIEAACAHLFLSLQFFGTQRTDKRGGTTSAPLRAHTGGGGSSGRGTRGRRARAAGRGWCHEVTTRPSLTKPAKRKWASEPPAASWRGSGAASAAMGPTNTTRLAEKHVSQPTHSPHPPSQLPRYSFLTATRAGGAEPQDARSRTRANTAVLSRVYTHKHVLPQARSFGRDNAGHGAERCTGRSKGQYLRWRCTAATNGRHVAPRHTLRCDDHCRGL